MSRHFDTPIVSIYDLMVERHRKLALESESKEISIDAQKITLGKVEEEAMSNAKIWPKKPRTTKAVREKSSSLTLESESYRPLSSITAKHLTKKHTILTVPPPAKKEVISKLVEKMSKVYGRPKVEDVVPEPPENSPKQVSGIQRKGKGTFRNKQKPNKSNLDRRPLSPRKAERGPKEKKAERGPKEKKAERGPKEKKAERGPRDKAERVPKEKTILKSTPKLPETSGRQVRSVRESVRSSKTVPLPTDRWRI